MKLYGFPPSPNTRKVLALAAHIGVPIELQMVDLTKGKSRTPDFLEINPNGRTPVLEDGDFRLWESNAILQYVAGKKKNDVWPDDLRMRADITRWQCWQLAQFNEGCAGLTFQRVVKPLVGLGAPDPVVVAKSEEAFHRDAKVLDGHLAKGKYLVNDQLTLADFAVAALLTYAEPAKMPLEGYKNVRDWRSRMEAVPAWKQTAPKI
jgi:glutathione S-transferase